MSDLDGTLIPAGLDQLKDFAMTLKEIEDKTGADVKFCPISGRTSGYVLKMMDDSERYLKDAGLKDGLGYGAAELGGIILYGKDQPFKRTFLYPVDDARIVRRLRKDVMGGPFSKIFETDPDAHLVTAFVIKSEILKKIKNTTAEGPNQENEIKNKTDKLYKSLRDYLENKYGNELSVVFSGVIEVKPPEISKENAIKWMLNKYSKEYDIKGLVYCGDSENDKKAVEYVSKLAMIPGIKANVFIPSNAMDVIKSENMERWKEKFEKFGVKKSIKISKYQISDGITDLLKNHLKKGELIDNGPTPTKTKDDFGVSYN